MRQTVAERMRAYRARHLEEVRERERERMRSRSLAGYKPDPAMKRAHKHVAYALARGRLIRQPCEVCGAEKVEAHHDDYARPLDVRWLCRDHHEELHHPVALRPR